MPGARIRRRGVYAGSFDPVTCGHAWVIEAGAALFDELIVAVGHNPEKHSTFTVEEREAFLREVAKAHPNVKVTSFTHRFLIHYAKDVEAGYILRGIRNPNDFENEQVMRIVNADLDPSIQTVFVMPPRKFAEISSSFVKGLVGPQGWEQVVKSYVPACVHKAFLAKARAKAKAAAKPS